MANLAETITRICDDLSRPDSEMSEVAQREILSAIKYYDGYRFAFNERVLDFTFSATNTYLFYTLVQNDTGLSAVMEIDDVKVIYNSHEYMLERLDWKTFYDLDKYGTTATIPDYWSVYNQRLFLYPTPQGSSLSAEITAHVKLVELDGATVVANAWLDQGEELIRSRACKMICLRKLDDFEKGNMFSNLEAEALKSLFHESSRKHQSGILRSND